MSDIDSSRRRFLCGTGGVAGAGWLALHWPAIAAAAEHAHGQVATPPARAAGDAFQVLSTAQARDVDAIAAQIVPGGDPPGAREAGVVYFVDRVLAGTFASQAPEFLAGLESFRDAFSRTHPGPGSFADLPDVAQVAYLRSVEQTPFFGQMRFMTVLGLLALPSYGGNRDRGGWRLVGFVDRHVWEPPFGHYDAGYAGFVPYGKEERS
jgi:gluconate 2-dehydrogenase gamma chain